MSIEKWVIAPGESRVIDLELVRKLKVSLIGGKVDVIAHDEPGARIEITGVTGKDLKVEIDGDVLDIDHPQLRWDNFIEVFKGWAGSAKAQVSILAPRHVVMKLGMVSGDTLVSGFATDAKLSTVSGDLVLDTHEGDVELSSVSGEMSAGNHVGRITAHSVSGDIVATGDVRSFNADTVSGDMVLDAYGTPDRVDTNTVSGDLTVRFDTGSGARYRINTVSGTVLLDDTTIKGMLGKGFERVTGELAGRWLDLGANSVSGSISVMRREPTERADAAGRAHDDSTAAAGPTGAEASA
ncbi:DUF4097 domain-containing protein [Agromyces sp. SYSU K20354]|uniref:DUF4097 family beta strand repeat-containing protein n=1 Tax=Agromyces cavernae TaxID=2898659 RepID=UPI001E43B129|nr:DUF4097 family beta strand repeat-containing protein [Agromyces cavernae]MCD2441270.1 DUF4097 domain-containing protein [Agromyces cavernae]